MPRPIAAALLLLGLAARPAMAAWPLLRARAPALPPGYALLDSAPAEGTLLLTPGGRLAAGPAPPLAQAWSGLVSPSASAPPPPTSTPPARALTLPCDGCPDTDTRAAVPDTQAFPFSAVGALAGTVGGGTRGVTCTGALIGPRHVLTAAHCVWDAATNAPVSGLTFTPGQAGGGAAFRAPLGTADVAWARVLASFPRTGPYTLIAMASDIALVTLARPAHRAAGWLAVPPAEGSSGSEPAAPAWPDGWNLSTAGYPADQAGGSGSAPATSDSLAQWETACTGGALAHDWQAGVGECAGGGCSPLLRHGCPSATGQSGSRLWSRGDGFVRGVLVGHVSVEVGGVDVPDAALNLGLRPGHPAVRATLAAWFGEDEAGAALPTAPSGQRPRRRLVSVLGIVTLDMADGRTVGGIVAGALAVGLGLTACAAAVACRALRRRRVAQGLRPAQPVRGATAVVERGGAKKGGAGRVEVSVDASGFV